MFYLFLDRGEVKEKEGERNIDVQGMHRWIASCMPPTGNLAGNPGMFPAWEPKYWPFGFQASTQSAEPHSVFNWSPLWHKDSMYE